jgi:hypothetical protein
MVVITGAGISGAVRIDKERAAAANEPAGPFSRTTAVNENFFSRLDDYASSLATLPDAVSFG